MDQTFRPQHLSFDLEVRLNLRVAAFDAQETDGASNRVACRWHELVLQGTRERIYGQLSAVRTRACPPSTSPRPLVHGKRSLADRGEHSTALLHQGLVAGHVVAEAFPGPSARAALRECETARRALRRGDWVDQAARRWGANAGPDMGTWSGVRASMSHAGNIASNSAHRAASSNACATLATVSGAEM